MSLIDDHKFDRRRGLCGLETDYHLVRTTCCAAFGVEEHELGVLYFDPDDLSRSVSLLENNPCPFCGKMSWQLERVDDFSEMPRAWRWAAPQDLLDDTKA
jgi:hypothetical protein